MKQGMKDFTVTIEAGSEQQIDIHGNYFHVLESTTEVGIQFDEGQRIKRKAGQGGSASSEYEQVTISSSVLQTVRISLGYGTVQDNTANVTGNVTANWTASNSTQSGSDVTILAGSSVQVVAANTKRQTVIIMNSPENENTVRLGDNTVNANSGLPLSIGGSASLDCQTAFSVFNGGDTDALIHVLELEVL